MGVQARYCIFFTPTLTFPARRGRLGRPAFTALGFKSIRIPLVPTNHLGGNSVKTTHFSNVKYLKIISLIIVN